MTVFDVLLAFIGAAQVISLAYLEKGRRDAKKACGTASCIKALQKALGVNHIMIVPPDGLIKKSDN